MARHSSTKFSSELINKLHSSLKRESERLDQCKTFSFPLHRYLSNEICICLKLIFRGQKDAKEFYALISYTPEIRGRHPIDCHVFTGIHSDHFPKSSRRSNNQQKTMLVDDVPFIEFRKKVILRIGTHIRLYRFDDFFCGSRNALYTSALTGLNEFFSRGANGELMASGMSSALFFNKSPHQMIKGGSKEVDDFPSKNCESGRRSKLPVSRKDIVKSIVLELFDYSVRVRVSQDEGSNLKIEILDVLFGPLNLFSCDR